MRILLIADLHIGSIKDTNYVYRVVTDIIDKEVIFNKTDMIIFLGDYFDRLFKVNEEYTALAINVMNYIVRACRRNNTIIRMIYGTESHEMNQYRLFNYHLTSKSIDMKVIDTITEETINGCHILYVPEEYISDKHEHYKKYLYNDNHYDYIFGHGIIEEGMPNIVTYSNESNKNNEKFVPRFKVGELSPICNISIWGHYHVYTDMGNVYYLGSLFRNSFGEEKLKGYGIIENNKFTFVENTEAYIYKTYEFGPLDEIYNDTKNLIDKIYEIKEENKELFDGKVNGKIRLLFRTPENLDSSFKESLRDLLINNKIINYILKESNSELIEEVKEDIDDEYSFVIDPSMNITDKLFQYISKEFDNPMSLETLIMYLNKK